MEQFLAWLAGNTIVFQIIAAILSLLAGYISGNILIRVGERGTTKEKPTKVELYSERLSRLTQELTKASSDVDNLLTELAKVAKDREFAVQRLEVNLTSLEEREKKLQKRIDDLKNIPVPVAEHFASLLEQGEKKSAWRDYMLFGMGVVLSTVIAIILRLIGLG